jgi:subtilase family serine protease
MTGCSRLTREATVNWNNLNPGVHKYWVKLDSTNAVVELSEGDNVGTGTVFINPNQSFVPVVSRNQ